MGPSSPQASLRVLMVLTYYLPHSSGLTIYAQRLAEALAARGHQVTVLASRHAQGLAQDELLRGVRVYRSDVIAHVGKGVLCPTLILDAARLAARSDVVHLHLPLLEAGPLAWSGRMLLRRPVVLTYHCDLRLPWSVWSKPILAVMQAAHLWAGRVADRLVTYTQDYADNSAFLSRFGDKVVTVLPPVVVPTPTAVTIQRIRERLGDGAGPVIGFAGRFASEKGIEYLLATVPVLRARFRGVKYVFAGEHERVLGEDYYRRLQNGLNRYKQRLVFLGNLDQEELAAFYAVCDVLTLPSLNSTESFGLVQVEAMLCGTPVVASDLPGVRQPVRLTGMGEIARPGHADELAAAITRVVENRASYIRPRAFLEETFAIERTVKFYEQLYSSVMQGVTRRP